MTMFAGKVFLAGYWELCGVLGTAGYFPIIDPPPLDSHSMHGMMRCFLKLFVQICCLEMASMSIIVSLSTKKQNVTYLQAFQTPIQDLCFGPIEPIFGKKYSPMTQMRQIFTTDITSKSCKLLKRIKTKGPFLSFPWENKSVIIQLKTS